MTENRSKSIENREESSGNPSKSLKIGFGNFAGKVGRKKHLMFLPSGELWNKGRNRGMQQRRRNLPNSDKKVLWSKCVCSECRVWACCSLSLSLSISSPFLSLCNSARFAQRWSQPKLRRGICDLYVWQGRSREGRGRRERSGSIDAEHILSPFAKFACWANGCSELWTMRLLNLMEKEIDRLLLQRKAAVNLRFFPKGKRLLCAKHAQMPCPGSKKRCFSTRLKAHRQFWYPCLAALSEP